MAPGRSQLLPCVRQRLAHTRPARRYAGIWMVATGSLYTCTVVWRPARFAVPLTPLVPSLAVFVNTFLITSLGPAAWVRFAAWLVLGLIVYVSICFQQGEPALLAYAPVAEQELVGTAADRSRGYSTSRSNPVSPRTPKDTASANVTAGTGSAFDATVVATLDES
jgi:C-terminus of AA_permease